MTFKVDSNSLIGKNAPNVYIQSAVLENNSPPPLGRPLPSGPPPEAGTVCKLTLGLKDILNYPYKGAYKGPTGWSNNKGLYDQYEIKVIRSLDPNTTDKLLAATGHLGASIFGELNKKSIRERVAVQDISLSGLLWSDVITRSSGQVGTDGHVVRNLSVDYMDSELPKEIQHLTYFVVAYCGIWAPHARLGPRAALSLIGNPAVLRVVNNGALSEKTTLYMTTTEPKGGEIWAGPVHLMPNGEHHTGPTHSSNSKTLTPLQVEESRIQDLRIVSGLNKEDFNLISSQVEDFPVPPDGIKLLFRSTLPDPRSAIFTDLYSSHDSKGNVRFFFGVDYNSLILQNMRFGELYSKMLSISDRALSVTAQKYMVSSDIQRMTIKRRRTDPAPEFNKLSSPVNGAAKFDEEEVDSFIFSDSGAQIRTSTAPSPSRHSSLHRVPLHTGTTSSGFQYFTGIDTGLKGEAYGQYQYKVEIEVVDNSDRIVHNLIEALESASSSLTYYRDVGSLPQNFKGRSNRFNKNFLSANSGGRFANALNTYVEILSLVVELSSQKQRPDTSTHDFRGTEGTRRALHPLLFSAYANPDSVQLVIGMIDSLASSLMTQVGVNAQSGKSSSSSAYGIEQLNDDDRTSRATGFSMKLLEVTHVFEKQFDVNNAAHAGYDYLTTSTEHDNFAGLFSIDEADFFKRVGIETNKFFSSNNPNIDILVGSRKYTTNDSIRNMDVQYLSPASLKIFGHAHALTDELSPESYRYRDVEKDVLYYNLQSKLNGQAPGNTTDSGCEDAQVTEMKIAQSYSIQQLAQESTQNGLFISVGTTGRCADAGTTDEEPIVAPSIGEPPYPSATLPLNLMPPMSPVLNGLLKKEVLTPQQGGNCEPECSTSIDSCNTLLDCNETFSSSDPDIRQDKLLKLPNQIKSIILGNIGTNVVNIDWFSIKNPEENDNLGALFRLNFNTLCKIEVLTGFNTSAQGSELARSPIFRPLSRQIISSAQPGTQMLCRMVQYTNNAFGLSGFPNNLKLPIYNEYFLLRKQGDLSARRPPPRALRGLDRTLSMRGNNDPVEFVQYSHTVTPPSSATAFTRAPTTRSPQDASTSRRGGY